VKLLAGGVVTVPVVERYRMNEADRAYERFAAGEKFGKIILLP
jgi:NADPH:quinone reductase-like Zn-dependent oxidoreductase